MRKDKLTSVMLLLLGTSEECTQEFIQEFAMRYSLPTHAYNNTSSTNQFTRYSKWLEMRNKMIHGFSKYENKYYMVADRRFYHCYSRYGFCSSCGILRCSSVWCMCGLI